MTDVELIKLGNGGDGLDVVVVQAMAGIDLQALAGGIGGAGGDALELGVALRIRGGIGIAAGVDLDEGGTTLGGRIDLDGVGVDEERHLGTDGGEAGHRIGDLVELAGHVQATLGGHLGALLRHQADELGLDALGDADHLLGHRHLQVHPGLDGLAQYLHVAVGDVAAIFTQVNRNAIGTGLLGHEGGLDRIRILGAAGIAQGGDMVDVHTQVDFTH
ncbi:hypothetical protein D3C79_771350 [compost metagenome]